MNLNMAKKALMFLLIVVSLLIVATKTTYAQPTLYDEPFSPQTDVDLITNYRAVIEENNCMTPSLECLVHQTFRFVSVEFVHSTLYSEFKPSLEGGAQEIEYDPNNPTQVGAKASGGVLAGTGKLIGQFYAYPVASTQTYVADLMNSAHITPRAYAQGLGFSALNPILELWKAFRNIAYMFFVLIFIVIGFMIMFRQRMGGQAAITAQQAIPSVIISLIFVTFSYAIAGFLIDMMYLSMFLIIGIFGQTLPAGSENLIDMNILQVMGALFKASSILSPDPNQNIGIDLVSNLLTSLVNSQDLSNFLGLVGGLTLSVVLAIAILIGTIKLFFELLKSYASVVISVVVSPIILMQGALPGKNPIVDWLKNIIGNLLPFPVVLLVLVFFYQFKNLEGGAGNEGGFLPPFLIGRGSSNAIASLMGLALILALPEIVKESKKGLVKDGLGGIIFRAAADSAKQAWRGGELIPGTGIKVPGANRIVRYPVAGAATAGGAVAGLAGGTISYGTGKAARIITRGRVGWQPESPFITSYQTGKKALEVSSKKLGLRKEKKT
jgi:hypothetical protein